MSQNTDAINGAYEAFASGDVAAIMAIVEDGAEWVSTESLPQGGSFKGPEGAGQFFHGVFTMNGGRIAGFHEYAAPDGALRSAG
jgi:ketosteroid isomerase-like protein